MEWDPLSVRLSTGGSGRNKISCQPLIWGKYQGGHLRRQPYTNPASTRGSATLPTLTSWEPAFLLVADEEADD